MKRVSQLWICTIRRPIARTRLKAMRNAADRNNECRSYASRSLNREGARCLGVSSRLSTNSISRFESHRVSSAGARWIFRPRVCGYCSFMFAIRCVMMNTMAQTKPTSEELRAELNDLRSTATRLIEQASCLMERCAELEDQISRGTSKPTKS